MSSEKCVEKADPCEITPLKWKRTKNITSTMSCAIWATPMEVHDTFCSKPVELPQNLMKPSEMAGRGEGLNKQFELENQHNTQAT